MALPDLLPIDEIRRRLLTLFPEGTEQRPYLTREMAARVVFTMLYIDAVEGHGPALGPKHVYAMSNAQSSRRSERARLEYAHSAWKAGYVPTGKAWYADTTREPIRDETLKEGLVRVGAVVEDREVPTTSSKPRYAMRPDFAALFDPALEGARLQTAIAAWQRKYMEPLALARIQLLRRGAAISPDKISVTLPNGAVRQMAKGPSSILSKTVIEEFAVRFLHQPAVLLLSESGAKVIEQDEAITRSIGLTIKIDRLLPDIILFDLRPDHELVVFVEVVATDGPITARRKEELISMAQGARFPSSRIAFVTAYRDRDSTAFKRTFGALAWNSFVWFMSEPERIVWLRDRAVATESRLPELLL